jgi:hypothetical protein
MMSESQRKKPERLAPPLEIVLLDEISGKLSDLISSLNSQVPRGVAIEWENTVTYSSSWFLDFVRDKPTNRLFKVDLINKGPNQVRARVRVLNQSPYEITVDSGEDISVDAKKAAIESVELYVDSGNTADVKVLGLY